MDFGQPPDHSRNDPPRRSLYPEVDHSPVFAWSGRQEGQSEVDDFSDGSNTSINTVEHEDSTFYYEPHLNKLYHEKESNTPTVHDEEVFDDQPSTDGRYNRSDGRNPAILSDCDQVSDDEDLTEADSDYMNVQSNIAMFKASLRKTISLPIAYSIDGENDADVGERQDRARGRLRGRPRGRPRGRGRGRGILRGPRKAAEPTGDIKSRLSRASQAFIDENYIEALELVSDVIRINAETHEAWILLASIFRELGDLEKTLTALMCAAHLRPKDVAGWLSCAQFALEETGDQRPKYLVTAKLCFQSAIRANPRDSFEARYGKAAVLRELGSTVSAISEYQRLLRQKPHDTTILRLLAEVHIDQDDVEAALELYHESISFYRTVDGIDQQLFGWSDINIYVELYAYLGQYDCAIKELKSLSRWALGRQQESWWDLIMLDDREWDADDSRRIQVKNFIPGAFGSKFYGEGLPLELRVKLGLYRLRLGNNEEALRHLYWLDPENLSGEDRTIDYPDLFRETADRLLEASLYEHALSFYKALSKLPNQNDPSLHLKMGQCYLTKQLSTQAEECFQTAIQLDNNNIEARVQLAKMYEALNEQEQAFIYISEIMKIRRTRESKQRSSSEAGNFTAREGAFMASKPARKTYYKPRKLADPIERQRQETLVAERLQEQYSVMRMEQSGMRAGKEGPTAAWMEAAQDLIEDFRGFKKFYPWDKYVHFLGYTGAARAQAQTGATPLDADLLAMADRLSHGIRYLIMAICEVSLNVLELGANIEGTNSAMVGIPENYRGISFSSWLDIFLEFALCLARVGRHRESYEICEAARDAIVFYHSREDMFLIHICWCTCALFGNDEQTCVSTCRFFTRDYQFTTDTYRMFAALARLCQSPISWYTSGPTQKYILRQIKAMDYALVDDDSRKKYFAEKGSYSAQDDTGCLLVNQDLDIALLMLYGHILYAGTSYPYALNYFFRAFALDPGNPMINLSIGLGYIHYGLKRQSENRQFHITQGLSFLFRYYESRNDSQRLEERQEAHYNVGRTYHMLGLPHLALPYYSKLLEETLASTEIGREDLVRDVAYNLQTLYAMSGNLDMSRWITENWLVI